MSLWGLSASELRTRLRELREAQEKRRNSRRAAAIRRIRQELSMRYAS